MKYRSRTDIVATILEAANGGATKTRIMYKAYLSYAQLKEYLSILVGNGLLEYEEGELKYKTTEKGLRFMRTYSEIGQMVSPETS
jgi:predicted transcriptional regulator